MQIGEKGVKYGLQVRQPKKPAARPPAKQPSVFGDEDSDEDEPKVEQQIARQAARKQTDKKVSAPIQIAAAEITSISPRPALFAVTVDLARGTSG
jgi:hypothetical protein